MKNITVGKIFTRLTVVSKASCYVQPSTGKKLPKWNCLCSCGKKVIVHASNLNTGNSKSCGCLNKELIIKANTKHNKSHSFEYNIWKCMKSRCYNINYFRYSEWGGRGIIVCVSWKKSFEAFYKDMGKAPSKQHSIERIDNSKNYTLTNCKWADKTEQVINQKVRNDNTSGYKGVHFHKPNNCWVARISYYKKRKTIGSFSTALAAATARNNFIKQHNLPHKLAKILEN